MKRITLGSSDPYGYFGYNELPDQIIIQIDRRGGVDIYAMKTQIANHISNLLKQGSLTIKNMCLDIDPEAIYIDELNSLDDYDKGIDFEIRPINYKVIFPNTFEYFNNNKTSKPSIHIEALCEDDLNQQLLPLNYHIDSIDRVGVGYIVAHVVENEVLNTYTFIDPMGKIYGSILSKEEPLEKNVNKILHSEFEKFFKPKQIHVPRIIRRGEHEYDVYFAYNITGSYSHHTAEYSDRIIARGYKTRRKRVKKSRRRGRKTRILK
jgi:hypothetical protein